MSMYILQQRILTEHHTTNRGRIKKGGHLIRCSGEARSGKGKTFVCLVNTLLSFKSDQVQGDGVTRFSGFLFPDLARIPKKDQTSDGARDIATAQWND